MKRVFLKFIADIKNIISKLSDKDRKKIIIGIIFLNAIILSIVIYFRFAIYDEKLFLHETVMMSEVLKQGKWIGNYGVGVHGFIFKLPIAVIFILTGPNIYIATFFHVILASLTVWTFYLFVEENFKLRNWSIIAVILLVTNYTFFSYSTTFHREIPVLFSLVLFTYSFVKNNKKILLNGLLLLLILEAKEYVFIAMLVPLLGYLFVMDFSGFRKIIGSILSSIKNFLLLLVPSAVYLWLMFYTSLLPINMFNASFMGLTTSGFSYQLRHALPENALSDMSTYTNTNMAYNTAKEASEDTVEKIDRSNFFVNVERVAITISGYALGYMEKFLYITNFSFQGLPFVLLIPSLASSIYLYKKWYRSNRKLLFLNIFFGGYLVIYMIRSSLERYILTVIPLAIIFLIFFLILALKREKEFKAYFKVTLLICIVELIAAFFFQSFSNLKELFNIFASFVFIALLTSLFFTKKYKKVVVLLITIFIVISSIFVSSYAILAKNQIYQSSLWGINGEADKIAKLLNKEDIIFVDCKSGTNSEFAYLINVYTASNYLPIEWHWKLDPHKVNRELDEIKIQQKLYYYELSVDDLEKFKSDIYKFKINKIVMLKSTIKGETFPLEKYIEVFKNQDWLTLKSKTSLKNKEVYIFEVIGGEI